MSFWFGNIDSPELARRIVRYCGFGWIALACLNTVVVVLGGFYTGIFGTIFAIAAARACFERSRTATTMVFGLIVLCAGVNILGMSTRGTGIFWLDAIAVLVWMVLSLSAYRAKKAAAFLNDEELKEVAQAP